MLRGKTFLVIAIVILMTVIAAAPAFAAAGAGNSQSEAPSPSGSGGARLCHASLGNRVWFDADYNGRQATDYTAEPGVEGVTVELYKCNGTYVGSDVTDANGFYKFDYLALGQYRLKFIKPASFQLFTLQDQGAGIEDSDPDPLTGETTCITLSEYKYYDTWDAGLYGSNPTAVEMASFAAEVAGPAINVSWETVSEVDALGFNLYRATGVAGTRARLNAALVPSQVPGSPVGAVYSFLDTTAERGVTYYYWLESVDATGTSSSHGPATAALKAYDKVLPGRPRPVPAPVVKLP